ncbi:hypothetical protein [Vibrio navarrensis]|uniref:hypothetical protein n=1 Tax=Vibrio navarrensis TaxID=29495 RepID=UPI001869F878|nr:hypothetical protein [Vibrio navarrensis]MBE4607184.1 hypothetical protein [Vibrio navarrensis]MBE4610948.1 hypothetical protein [Vibrio navarrensis]
MKQEKAEANNSQTTRKFVPKAENFKVSTSYEGLTASGKPQSLEALKRQWVDTNIQGYVGNLSLLESIFDQAIR